MSEENTKNNQQESASEVSQNHNYDFKSDISAFSDVKIGLKAVLGSVKMSVGQFLKITQGSILELEQRVDSDLSVFVNNHKAAEGEIIVNEDIVAVKIKNSYKHKKY